MERVPGADGLQVTKFGDPPEFGGTLSSNAR
jgi:hypothetical protein